MNRTSEQNGIVPVPPAQHILDALTGPVAVLDQTGAIIAVNEAWRTFGEANQAREVSSVGVNYLDVCDRASLNRAHRPRSGVRRQRGGA